MITFRSRQKRNRLRFHARARTSPSHRRARSLPSGPKNPEESHGPTERTDMGPHDKDPEQVLTRDALLENAATGGPEDRSPHGTACQQSRRPSQKQQLLSQKAWKSTTLNWWARPDSLENQSESMFPIRNLLGIRVDSVLFALSCSPEGKKRLLRPPTIVEEPGVVL